MPLNFFDRQEYSKGKRDKLFPEFTEHLIEDEVKSKESGNEKILTWH